MGGQTSSQYKRQDPTLHSRETDREQTHAIFQSEDGTQFEKYVVTNDGSSEFQNSYEFRTNNRHNELVDVIFAGPQQNSFGCSLRAKYNVVTERIPYRLAHLPTQHAYNSLILLRVALTGFRDVFKYHGIISVKDTMIGITPKNKVKVWLNSNFSINRPEEKAISLQKLDPKDHEREMVNNIFDLISSKAEQQSLWIELAHRREMNDPRTFDDALALVEQFIETKGLRLFDQLRNPFNKPAFEPKTLTNLPDIPDERPPNISNRLTQVIIPPPPVIVGPNTHAPIIAQTPYFGRQGQTFTPIIPKQNQIFRPFEQIQKRMVPHQRKIDFSRSPQKVPVHNRILINSQQHSQNVNNIRPVVKFNHRKDPVALINTTVNKFPTSFSPVVRVDNRPRSPIKQILNIGSRTDNVSLKPQQSLNQRPKDVIYVQFNNVNIDNNKGSLNKNVEQVITSTNTEQLGKNVLKQQAITPNSLQSSPQKQGSQNLKSSHYNIEVHNVSSQSQKSLPEDQPSTIKKDHSYIEQPHELTNQAGNANALPVQNHTMSPLKFVLDATEHKKDDNSRQQHVQNLKTAVKASLIDTKDIRRESLTDKPEKKWNGPRLFNTDKPISYRDMRRLLLESTASD